MADLLPSLSSDEEGPTDDADEGNEDDMDETFEFGGILGEDGSAPAPLGWSFGTQIHQHQRTQDVLLPRMKVMDLIKAKRKAMKQENGDQSSAEEDENNDDNDSSSDEESVDEENGGEDLEKDTLKFRAGKEEEEEGSGDEASDGDGEEEAKAAAYFKDVKEANDDEVSSFAELALSRPILKGVAAMGFVVPTPIQAAVIPIALSGRDVCASAQTGSGKTAAFLLPILEKLLHRVGSQALVLTPTRELAAQCVGMMETLAKFSDLTSVLVVGGAKNTIQSQTSQLRTRPDVIVATPGRLLDHVTNSAGVTLENANFLVLDEADRLLDLGFQDEIMELVKFVCPTVHRRQTLLFSATLQHAKVEDLVLLSLKDPVRVRVGQDNEQKVMIPQRLEQEFVRIRAGNEGIHREAVLLALLTRTYMSHCIVFFDTKVAAHRLMVLCGLLNIKCTELHGNLTQVQRLEALEEFRKGSVDVLLATDLAARGLDIDSVQSVINFEMPSSLETYIHRVGRTARASKSGVSCTLIGESRRTLMKQVVKRNNGNAIVRSRTVPASVISHFATKIQGLQTAVREVLQAEAVAKLDRVAEMEILRAQNLIEHADEIKTRPQREWFASTAQKMTVREAAAEKLRKIQEAAGTGTHKMTRKKRRAREAMESLNAHDSEDEEEGRKPKKPVNQKVEARKHKRENAEKTKAPPRVGAGHMEPKPKKAKANAADGLGDGSLFSEEMSSYPAKGKPKPTSTNTSNDVARSTYSFRGYDPDKRLGKKKGHNAFKSKAKHKRRK